MESAPRHARPASPCAGRAAWTSGATRRIAARVIRPAAAANCVAAPAVVSAMPPSSIVVGLASGHRKTRQTAALAAPLAAPIRSVTPARVPAEPTARVDALRPWLPAQARASIRRATRLTAAAAGRTAAPGRSARRGHAPATSVPSSATDAASIRRSASKTAVLAAMRAPAKKSVSRELARRAADARPSRRNAEEPAPT